MAKSGRVIVRSEWQMDWRAGDGGDQWESSGLDDTEHADYTFTPIYC
jgi:hypothetical protein